MYNNGYETHIAHPYQSQERPMLLSSWQSSRTFGLKSILIADRLS
jgi:hypothetical protein